MARHSSYYHRLLALLLRHQHRRTAAQDRRQGARGGREQRAAREQMDGSLGARPRDVCDELMARTWSSSSWSGDDSDHGSERAGLRKRRSPSTESSHSDASELSDVSEPGDGLDDVLNQCAKFLPANEQDAASLIDPIEAQQLITEDLSELPELDDHMLGALPALSPQPVMAIPVQVDEPSAAAAGRSDSDSADDTAAPPVQKLDKRQRNRMAAAKCRRNKRLREAKVREELEQLQKKVCTLQNEKKQMQSQLEQFRTYFSQQNLSSALLSGLCVICAVICVVAPHGMTGSSATYADNQHFASTGRSLLSLTVSPPPPPPPHDVAGTLWLQDAGGMTATDLLLSCLSAAQHTTFQEVA